MSGSSTHRAVRLPLAVQMLLLAALVLVASLSGLHNNWVQDDLPIIVNNATLHSLAHPANFFNQAWWPAPYSRELYRPIASTLLALQWAVSGGAPIWFRAVSYLLYIAATLSLFLLARRLVSPTAAWLAAAFFAVHPLHVEAVAVAVNQGEILTATFSIILLLSYLRHRDDAAPLPASWIVTMACGYAVAALCKESGMMIPAIFVAAELTIVRDPRPWRERLVALRPLYLALVLVAVAIIEVRSLVLAGNTRGTFTAEALVDLTMSGRAVTMLGVVPTWARLLLWPQHLQADYSPQEIVGTTHWGIWQSAGALMVIATLLLAWFARKRQPLITFLVLWLAIALFPVSNVLVPTGIVVAERTLFAATIAVVLLGAFAIAPWVDRALAAGAVPRLLTATAVALVLGLGAWRSASRQLVWFDVTKLWFQSLTDAPLSYRVHHTWGEILFKSGDQRTGVYHYRRAIELRPSAWPVYYELAEKYRGIDQCQSAVRLYRGLLKLAPEHTNGRASLIACLVHLGEYRAAEGEARIGVGYGAQMASFQRYARIADSADRVHAPAGSVKLPVPADTLKQP